MDPNPKSSTAIDATDSTVSSLVSSFVQLEIIADSTGGPINRLPNEMMQLIVAKLDGDGNELVRLRLVSTKWNCLVKHYCQKKKSLLVNWNFFAGPNLNNYAPLIVRLKNVKLFGIMLKLFPNIEQLVLGFHRFEDDNQILVFSVGINSLNSLKQLELYCDVPKAVLDLSQTLSQLEHIGLFANYSYYSNILNEGDLLNFVSNLGPNCVRVMLGGGLKLKYDQIIRYHKIKPNLFANLTHLGMCTSSKSDRVLHLLTEHATRLEFLYIKTRDELLMSPSLIHDLAKLVHLSELKISSIRMDIAALDKAAAQLRLSSLTSVLTCDLHVWPGQTLDGDKFTRVLSVIFPKLINLHLCIAGCSNVSSRRFLIEIRQNMHRFSNLRKHKICSF